MIWANAVVQGILLGGLYALFACGLSLMFGVMRIVNLAHGDLGVLAAYFAVVLVNNFGGNPLWSFVTVIPVALIFGYFLQRWLLDRTVNSGEFSPILVTFGLSIVIENLLQVRFGANAQYLNLGNFTYASWHINRFVYVGKLSLLIFAVAVAILAGLQLFLARTRQGRLLRATADNPRAAALCGVNAKHTRAVATSIAMATVATGGLFFAMTTSFVPASGSSYLIFAFESVIIGGLGNLWGTLIGGIVLGVSQGLGNQFSPADGILFGNIVFLIILAFRPQGLLAGASALT
jgi:branched-chain amino acid transport system permease protein